MSRPTNAAGRNLVRSGPNRRAYQRARYHAARIALPATNTAPTTPAAEADLAGLTATAAAYLAVHQDKPTSRSGHQLFAAILAAGHRVAVSADQMATTAIALADCARPTAAPSSVTSARAKANELAAQWHRIRVTEPDGVVSDDDLAADTSLPALERRWRQRVLAEYRASRDRFLELHRNVAGRDENWAQRAAIRAHSYDSATGARTVGNPPIAHTHRDLLISMFATYRPTLPGPVASVAVHADPLTVGENALRDGSLGGLVGDGWRTTDLEHRAFILGSWIIR